MKFILFLSAAFFLSLPVLAQSEPETAEQIWNEKLTALNTEYFEKLRTLQEDHVKVLESLKTDATTGDRLDDALKLRDQIEKFKNEMDAPKPPDDSNKLAKDKTRLANILRQSKWNCSSNPNLPKWAGNHLIFHENGTIVPAHDPSAKVPHHRWAILDGKTIVGMFGDYQIIFVLNKEGNALDVLEIGNVIDPKAKRHGYVVQSPSISKSLRDNK